jgi:threonine dehydrogenase-like Zn-dependent dehydrogenase
VSDRRNADRAGGASGGGEENREGGAHDAELALLAVERVPAPPRHVELGRELVRAHESVRRPLDQWAMFCDEALHGRGVWKHVRKQRFPDAGAVGRVATPDRRSHLNALSPRHDLRQVDDFGLVEPRVVHRLAETCRERLECRLDEPRLVSLLVELEREADELEAEVVAAARDSLREPSPPEGRERSVDARLRQVELGRELVQRGTAAWVPRELRERRQNAVSSGRSPDRLTVLPIRERMHLALIGTHFRWMEQEMKALVWHGGQELRLEEFPTPLPHEGEVLLDVSIAGICGSDLHPYRGHAGPRRPPLVLGHEAVGTASGRIGRFAVFPLITCGRCSACRRGEENLCDARGLLGLDRQGVFAEQVTVPAAALVPLPDGVADELAVLTEPLATCVATVRTVNLGPDSTVVVVGGGSIGLLTVHVAAATGARVIAVEPVRRRRQIALRLGAAEALEHVEDLTHIADVAVDAVGIESTWRGAVACVRSGGSVLILGLAQAEGSRQVGDLVRRGITIRGHYAYTRADFEAALALLAERPPPLDWLEVLVLEDGAEGFRRLVHEPENATKILLQVTRR